MLQYSYAGTATDKPLMEWLNAYTFPREAGLKNVKPAWEEYSRFVQRLLRAGTTTVLYFASLHLSSAKVLAEAAYQVCSARWRACAHRGRWPQHLLLKSHIVNLNIIQNTSVVFVVAVQAGQRALIGKVCMDRGSPPFYVQSTEQNIQETKSFITYTRHVVATPLPPHPCAAYSEWCPSCLDGARLGVQDRHTLN